LRAFWIEKHAHAFAGSHVALVGHPASDLAPEAVVVEVFHAAAPTPCRVDAHEEHLAVTGGFCDQQRRRSELAAAIAVDGEDLGTGFGFDDRGVPMEAGKLSPDFGVFLFVFSEKREQ
jgi:hypothetical protein